MTEIRYCANLSMLFPETHLVDRPAAAAQAGFRYVESWWPFPSPTPRADCVDAFCDALERAGARLVAINLDAGDPALGERGLLSLPHLEDRITSNVEVVATIVERTGCGIVNALYGNREPRYDPVYQDRVALNRLVAIADRLADLGVWVVVETLNQRDSPDFPLTDIAVSAEVVRRANLASQRSNIGLLLDIYHLATMQHDPIAALYRYADLIRHIQFADVPGRGRPGTGDVNFAAIERAVLDTRYAGYIGLEYDPSVASRADD